MPKSLKYIQITLDNNYRLMDKLKVRWAREAEEIAAKRESVEIYSIQINEDLKTMSGCESPTGPKHPN